MLINQQKVKISTILASVKSHIANDFFYNFTIFKGIRVLDVYAFIYRFSPANRSRYAEDNKITFWPQYLNIFAAVYLSFILISDFFNSSYDILTLEGIVGVILIIIVPEYIFSKYGNTKLRLFSFFIAYLLASITYSLLFSVGSAYANIYKFTLLNLGTGMTICMFAELLKAKLWILVSFITIWALVSSFMDSRVVLIYASCIVSISFIRFLQYSRQPFKKQLTKLSTIKKLIIVVIIPFLFINYLAFPLIFNDFTKPFLPEYLYSKTVEQYNPSLGIILSGRAESIVTVPAFKNNFFLGLGSKAEDKNSEFAALKLYSLYDQFYINDAILNLKLSKIEDKNYELSAHSILLDSAIKYGFTGFVFWLSFYFTVFRMFATYSSRYSYFGLFCMLYITWSLMFSNFGLYTRQSISIMPAVFFYYKYRDSSG